MSDFQDQNRQLRESIQIREEREAEVREIRKRISDVRRSDRKFFRSSFLRTVILDYVPVSRDVTVAEVRDYVCQHYFAIRERNPETMMKFNDLDSKSQWIVVKRILDDLTSEGQMERALGKGDNNKEAQTYNGVN